MKKIIFLLLFALIVSPIYADIIGEGTEFAEEDGSPSTVPYKVKVTNGTLTDNNDGTVSINTGGGGFSSYDNVTVDTLASGALQLKSGTGTLGQMLMINPAGTLSWANTVAGGTGGLDIDNITINTIASSKLQIKAGTGTEGQMLITASGALLWADTSAGGSTLSFVVPLVLTGNTVTLNSLTVAQGGTGQTSFPISSLVISGTGTTDQLKTAATIPAANLGLVALATQTSGTLPNASSPQILISNTVSTITLRFGTNRDNILPAGTGADNNVLKWDGATLNWEADAGGGLANIVEDLTPQLGGDLDGQAFNITTTGTISTGSLTVIKGSGTLTNMTIGILASNTITTTTLNAGTIPIASIEKIPLATHTTGTLPDASLSAVAVTHAADASDPHSATLTQTNAIITNLTGTTNTLSIINAGTLSIAGINTANSLSSTNLVISGNASMANIVAGTWSGDILLIGKIPTIPLETQTSGTLPIAAIPAIPLNDTTHISGTIDAASLGVIADANINDNITLTNITQITNRSIVNLSGTIPATMLNSDFGDFTCNGTTCTVDAGAIDLTNKVSGTIAADHLGLVSLTSQVSGTLPLANTYIIPLATHVSGTLPLANLDTIPLDSLNIQGTIPADHLGLVSAATQLSGTIANANLGIVVTSGTISSAYIGLINASNQLSNTIAAANLGLVSAATQLSGTIAGANLGLVALATQTSGTIPTASMASNIDTSAELFAILGDESGSGVLVGSTSPTFTTPVLGTATATSITATNLIITGNASMASTTLGIISASNSITTASLVVTGAASLPSTTLNIATANTVAATTLTVKQGSGTMTNMTLQAGNATLTNANLTILTANTITVTTLSGFADDTTGNASTSAHGFLKKLDNTATNFMNGAGNWAVPAGSGMQYTDTRFSVVSVTRDVSLITNQTITGAGFAPKGVIAFVMIDNTYTASWGMGVSPTSAECIFAPDTTDKTTGEFSQYDYSIGIITSGGSNAAGIVSFDADGITLDWNHKSASPTGTAAIKLIFFR